MTRDQLLAWFTEIEGRRPAENVSNRAGMLPEALAWVAEVGSLLESALPPGHFILREWQRPSPSAVATAANQSMAGYARVQQAIGSLIAARRLVEADRTGSLVDWIRAQAEGEVLDSAFTLLGGGYRVASAVLGGGALEVHLRHLFERTPNLPAYRGDPSIAKYDGSIAQARNLGQPVPYAPADSRSIAAWAEYRNTAAHTPDLFVATVAQVQLMLEGIRDFIGRTQ